ncbi:Ran-specific GTPase-activating protein [Vairimorpha necatrix]|uniref:Ran-specific GTPase-activating protein n=1 Tax=Vairimorpha necatrix TaxID=6039 RepID=A0AAX4JCN8_9MICR
MDRNFITDLNKAFLQKANEFVEENKPITELFEFYRKCMKKNIKEDNTYFKVDKNSIENNANISHHIQSSDSDEFNLLKNKSIQFKNFKKKNSNHVCSETEIYKFLVQYYDYECPYTIPTYKKRKVVETNFDNEDFTWPFLEPPKKPRTVFDSGPTREEVGEYNRRIFAAYTEYLNYENDVIPYTCNPNFIDEDADEEFCNNHHDHQFKAEIESYIYNGTDYIYQDKAIVRISRDKDNQLVFSLKCGKYNIESSLDNFKLYYIEHDGKVDVLNMENFTISRLLFNNETHSKEFYSYFDVPCE